MTGDTDITVYNLLLKVSSIDGKMKLDALDIDSSQGNGQRLGTARSCRITGRWTLPSNRTLNVDPMKGEKVQLKVGGDVRRTAGGRG